METVAPISPTAAVSPAVASLYNDAVRFSSLVTVAAALAFVGAGSGDLDGQLQSTAASYFSNVAAIARITGGDTTMDYYQRLLDDPELLKAPGPRAIRRRCGSVPCKTPRGST